MSGSRSRKVLVIAYHYLPAMNGGVERSAGFARRLPDFGWNAVVLTTNRFGGGGEEGPEEIVRTGELFARASIAPRGEGEGSAGADARRRSAPLRAIREWALSRLPAPDPQVRWTILARRRAFALSGRGDIDAVLTTSPPASAHLLGLAIKRRTSLPWIVDCRDPWTLEPLGRDLRRGGARLVRERRLERRCFEAADAIVLNTPEAAAEYRRLYPSCAAKMTVITNGYDGEEMAAARAALGDARGDGRIVMSHVGSFTRYAYETAYPQAFLAAVRKMREDGSLAGRCSIVFAGALPPAVRAAVEAAAPPGTVEFPGRLAHAEAMRLMLRSDILLLFDPNSAGRLYVHGKLYEYLAAGAWILGMVPEGASRSLLERSGRGIAVSPDDEKGIRAAIAELLRRRGSPPPGGFDISTYERRGLARSLAGLLDGIAG